MKKSLIELAASFIIVTKKLTKKKKFHKGYLGPHDSGDTAPWVGMAPSVVVGACRGVGSHLGRSGSRVLGQ